MWLFTRYGFFSVACAKDKDGKNDPNIVMVRSRSRQHLENLQKRFPDSTLGNAEIRDSVGTDYKYRVILPKIEWVAALSELASEQSWSNFKNEASRFAQLKKVSNGYVNALHEIWAIMFNLQS